MDLIILPNYIRGLVQEINDSEYKIPHTLPGTWLRLFHDLLIALTTPIFSLSSTCILCNETWQLLSPNRQSVFPHPLSLVWTCDLLWPRGNVMGMTVHKALSISTCLLWDVCCGHGSVPRLPAGGRETYRQEPSCPSWSANSQATSRHRSPAQTKAT